MVGHGIQANQGGSEVKTGDGQWGKREPHDSEDSLYTLEPGRMDFKLILTHISCVNMYVTYKA